MVIKLELWEIFPHIIVGLILPNIPSFLGLLLHGTKYIQRLENASLTVFKKHLLKEIWPVPHLVYNVYNPNGLKLLTRSRLCLSHLNEHRFNHNFEGYINPLCTCSLEVESTSHLFLHCHYFDSIRHIMFNELCEVDVNLLNASNEKLVNIFFIWKLFF